MTRDQHGDATVQNPYHLIEKARDRGKVVECIDGVGDRLHFLPYRPVGAPGETIWIRSDGTDITHTVGESTVVRYVRFCDPDVRVIPEHRSHFASDRDE